MDRYIRVSVTGTGLYTGSTVYSEPVGPVVGNPATLKALLFDETNGWGLGTFNGDSLSYTINLSHSGITPTHFVEAIPVSYDAEVSMKLTNSKTYYYDGPTADIPIALGMNYLTITVTYGSETTKYAVRIEGVVPSYRMTFTNNVPDSSIQVKVYGTSLIHQQTLGETEKFSLDSVSADARITFTALETPVGKQFWKYGNCLTADMSKSGDSYTVKCGELYQNCAGTVRFTIADLCAVAPAEMTAMWDLDKINTAKVTVKALKRISNGYYKTQLTVYDAETGKKIRTISQSSAAVLPDDIMTFVLTGMDTGKDYRLVASYPEHLVNNSQIPAGTQETEIVLKGLGDVQLIPDNDYFVLPSASSGEVNFTFNGAQNADIEFWETTSAEVATAVKADDDTFTILTMGEGTAWLTFRGLVRKVAAEGYPDGKPEYVYAYVRVDVSDTDDPEMLHLGETKANLNLFDDSTFTVPVHQMECEHKILGAEFVDSSAKAVFNIEVVNDRTVRVVPKANKPEGMTWADWGKQTAGTYTSIIKVTYRTEEGGNSYRFSEEAMTIKLTAKAPSVKATAVKLNSFYIGDTQKLVFTSKEGNVVMAVVDQTKATEKAPACPDWLTLNDDMTVSLINSKLDAKGKGSG